MVDARQKAEQLRLALESQNPNGIAKALRVPPVSLVKTTDKPPPSTSLSQQQSLITSDGTDYTSLLTSLVDVCSAAESGHALECYKVQSSLHTTFNRLFSSSEGNWLIPGLIQVCKNTHRIALAADQANILVDTRSKNAKLQNAVQILQDSYSKTSNDRTEFNPDAPYDTNGSKKAGVLPIVNELFSMYFRLNILRLCKNLIRPVETRGLNKNAQMGQMVTYRYYCGRLNMFEDQHSMAETNLDYAFRHCHRNAVGNKRRILRYLIPIRLYRGKLPTPQLLEEYNLPEFKQIVDGIQKGDLRTFQDGLIKYQDKFIVQGTYLLLEKCKTVCYRNLFKRVHKILEKHQISLSYVAKAFKWLGMPIDLDEIECILANLIYRGYIRGYLSHSKRVLVLSKKDPFPTSAVILKD